MSSKILNKGPLSGVKVLDFSTLLPGPYATMLLADMGAKVLRVESPTRVDLLREMAPKFDERSYAHLTVNRNKDSLALDLKHPKAKSLVESLLTKYDIIIEQFRPGVMAKFGLDYESLKLVNPKLIYCSITGFGQTGPLKDRAGHDINYLALSGLASYSGREETGPVLSGTQAADIAGGSHHAVMAILAAVIERQSSGEGQYLDISMSDAALSLNTMYGASALGEGKDPVCGGELLNGGIFYDYYRTKDNRYFSVGGLEAKFAAGFFAAIERPEWAARANAEPGEQGNLRDDIARLITEKAFDEWRDIFAHIDVCVEPVLTITEASQHAHFNARKMIATAAISSEKNIQQIASPLKFSRYLDRQSIRVGAKLGEHSRKVLLEMGLSDGEIDELIQVKAIGES